MGLAEVCERSGELPSGLEQEIVVTATKKDDGKLELVAQQGDRQVVKNAEAELSQW